MSPWPDPASRLDPPVRVGIAAHRHHFLGPVRAALGAGGCVIRDDPWQGHRLHRATWSAAVSTWADVVLAEWCLGNAVWHAAHRSDDTRLIVRLHRFEMETQFPLDLDVDRVDAVVCVAPHIRREAITRFGWPARRCVVVPNSVDAAQMDRPKAAEAFVTLGMVSWGRRLKRLDLALDVLEEVRRVDDRVRLRLKGARPEDTPHVWKYAEERDFFDRQYRRIESSPLLGDAVVFDPPGDDVPTWFTTVGHVLSLSDVESFHLALAEGMASRAAPVIIDRAGVAELFGSRWVVRDARAAATAVAERLDPEVCRSEGEVARALVVARYDRSRVDHAWRRLVTARP